MPESYLNFEAKTVVVTGGSKGIGAAIVKRFLQFGAKAVIADVDDASGEKAAEQFLAEGYEALFVHCDVSKIEYARKVVVTAESTFGGIDVLVNNAGIFPRASLEKTDEAFWEKVLGINLKGAYLMSQAASPGMIERGGGNIINIGSLHATGGEEITMAYAVSKGGIVTLTKNLAHSLAKHKIRVNCVHPGWVCSDGEMARLHANGMDDETVRKQGSKMPLGRMQTSEDVANAVAFIASDLASQITGQMLTVDGGATARR